MIKKHSSLSFAFCALILSSTLISTIACASPDRDPQSAQQVCNPGEANLVTAQTKTTKQRIVSGLAHTALFVTSLIYLVSISLEFTDGEKTAFGLLGTYGSYGAIKGVHHAIAKSEVAPEEPIELNSWTAAESTLLIPSLFMAQTLQNLPDKPIAKLFLLIPTFYALGNSLKTIYKLAQNRSTNAEEQPEIQTITE